MKKFFLLVALLLCSMAVRANDGTYYTAGNQLVPLMETDISVRKEVLTISLMDNGFAKVDVYYEFWNPNAQHRKVLMGFEADPPYNDTYTYYPDGVNPYIHGFSVEMNGMQLSYKNAPCKAGTGRLDMIDPTKQYQVFDDNYIYEKGLDPEHDTSAWDKGIRVAYVYYFDADFQPGLNVVHHTYTYRMSVVVGQPYVLEYKLTPAVRWANHRIDDFTLVIRADSTAKHFEIPSVIFPHANFEVENNGEHSMGKVRQVKNDYLNHYEFSLRDAAVKVHISNFVPEDELRLAASNSFDDIGASYERSSPVILYMLTASCDPKTMDTAFVKRVVHNLPFADRGHVFKDARLKKYFESLWWYMPDPTYKDDTSDFTPSDWEYVHFEWKK